MKGKKQNIYSQMQRFADLTKIIITNGQINRMKKCFAIAEELLQTGNREMKNAVVNVYLFSLSSYIELKGEDGRIWVNYFPALLRREYVHVIETSCYG